MKEPKNPATHAEALTKMAAGVAKELGIDAAGVITIHGNQVCLFMASLGENLTTKEAADSFEVLGKHLIQASAEVKSGKLKPQPKSAVFDLESHARIPIKPSNDELSRN